MSGIHDGRRGGALQGNALCLLALVLHLGACAGAPPPAEVAAPGGILNIRSSPPGARIGIDGEPSRFRTPAQMESLPPGQHLLSLTLRGYRLWEKPVTFRSGETVNLDVRLDPSATGSLSISSIPFMSLIFIDGRPTPYLTPATVTGLPVGTHTVLLRREGYEDWSHAVIILENRQMTLKASLRPAQGVRGNLDIRTNPPLADILVDGYPTGNKTPATIFNLLAGRHLLELKKEGYQPWREEVTVPEGVTSNLLVTLRRSEARLTGSAVITSTPPGAELFLDEVRVSSPTPVSFSTLTHGTHRLEVRKEGYWPWEGEITVRPGERTELSVPLRRKE